MSYLRFQLRQLLQRMWFLPAAFSAVAVLTVVIAYMLAGFAPDNLPFTLSSDAVQSILEILASSLLTVAVFALSTVVSALSSASSATTPRAVPLIAGDLRAQTSISVFIGAFLFSIVGIIGLSAGFYSEASRLFLFGVTLIVVVLVVTALIRWIGQISAIGRVANTIDAVEKQTQQAIEILAATPRLGCRAAEGQFEGRPITPLSPGYVQHCDAEDLQKLAEKHDLQLLVRSRPGAYATPVRPLLLVQGEIDEDTEAKLRDCFVVGDKRTFDSDPRFGFVVLGEIADKALSPGVNDPGTAIDVIDTATRLFLGWGEEADGEGFDRVRMAALDPRDVLEDVFRPIARDGAGVIEVMIRLLRGLETIAACNPVFAEGAERLEQDVLTRGMAALSARSDREALAAAVSQVGKNLSN
ncbi:Uncharacterized membrane protein [Devosia crocina]|uniref:Uncharacterized membrane protein n=1 Tax=Devosia crocina TaxID=429728 RepID=A0A1I7NMN7_9HYPH|nr:DUF2254 domain-containing protein [Devosia crocina]SFV35907.1 Uncharacterized membrane protein [Devosia crocina]